MKIKRIIRKSFLLILGVLGSFSVAHAQFAISNTIYFKDFTAGDSVVNLDSTSRIVLSSDDAELIDTINAPRGWLDKLRFATGLNLLVTVTSSPTAKDIVLNKVASATNFTATISVTALAGERRFLRRTGTTFASDKTIVKSRDEAAEREGFRYKVDAGGITLTFKEDVGAIRALTALANLIMQDGAGVGAHRGLPSGSGYDYPYFTERHYMLDVARHFISVEQLIGFMEKMSQHRMNLLHLHINDDAVRPGGSPPGEGFFRLASEDDRLNPDIRYSNDDNEGVKGFYTRADWDRLEAAAKRYGIEIVPEFDSPGHSAAWAQAGAPHWEAKNDKINGADLDTDDPSNRAENAEWMANLIMRYRGWFASDTIHLGNDETDNSFANDKLYIEEVISRIKKSDTVDGWTRFMVWIDPNDGNLHDLSPEVYPILWQNLGRIGSNYVDTSPVNARKWNNVEDYFVPKVSFFNWSSGPPHGSYNWYVDRSGGANPGVGRLQYVNKDAVPDGFGGANWNDVTMNERLGQEYINAGVQLHIPALGYVAWMGFYLRDSDGAFVHDTNRNYDRLFDPSRELMASWVNHRFPYLDAVQSTVILQSQARHRHIITRFRQANRADLESTNGTRDDGSLGFMAWDDEDMREALKGPRSFSGTYIADLAGEGNMMADGRICRDSGLLVGERGISACDQDVWTEVISGTGGLKKQGVGSLRLAGLNTFTGGVEVAGGELEIAAASGLGVGTSNVELDNGTLSFSADTTLSRNIALDNTNGGGINSNGNAVSLGGVISGNGQLRISSARIVPELLLATVTVVSGATTTMAVETMLTTGIRRSALDSGKVVLGGVNTFAGGLLLESGGLEVAADTALGVASRGLVFDSGELIFGSAFSLASTRGITLNANGKINTNGNDVQMANVIEGAGGLSKTGQGRLMLTGTNTYQGATFASGGVLVVDLADIPDASELITESGGTIELSASANGKHDGNASGGGVFKKVGSRDLTLKGTSGAESTWEIAAGKLVGESEFSSGISFTGTGVRSFEFLQAGEATYPGVLSGDGLVALASSGGRLTMTADSSSFTGILEVDVDNTMHLASSASMGGVINVKRGGVLSGAGTIEGMVVEGGGSFQPVREAVVTGDMTLAANARYLVNLGYRTHVMGDVNIGGGPLLALASVPPIEVDTSAPDGGGSFVIMTIDGTRTGTFAPDVNLDALPFVSARVIYEDTAATGSRVLMAVGHNDAKLTEFLSGEPLVFDLRSTEEIEEDTTQDTSQLPAGLIMTQPESASLNPVVFAELLDQAREVSVSLGPVLDEIVLNLSGDSVEMAQAFDALAAEVHASAKPMQLLASSGTQEVAVAQLRAGSDAVGSADTQQTRFSLSGRKWGLVGDAGPVLWVKALASKGGNPGDDIYKDIEYKGSNLLFGSDIEVAGHGRVGFFSGFGKTTFEQVAGNAEGTSNSRYLGFYGSWNFGRMLLRNGINYSRHSIEASRVAFIQAINSGVNLAGDYSSQSYGMFTQVGFPVQGAEAAVEPFIGINYMWHRNESFSELGEGIEFNMPETNTHMGALRLGMHALADGSLALLPNTRLSGSLSWDIGLKNPDTSVVQAVGGFTSSAKTQVSGVPLDASKFTLAAGIFHEFGENISLKLEYAYSQSTESSKNAVENLSGQFSYSF